MDPDARFMPPPEKNNISYPVQQPDVLRLLIHDIKHTFSFSFTTYAIHSFFPETGNLLKKVWLLARIGTEVKESSHRTPLTEEDAKNLQDVDIDDIGAHR